MNVATIADLTAARIVDAALVKSGVGKFTNDSFHEGLDAMVAGINANRRMTAAGRESLVNMMIAWLARRFLVEQYCDAHPALAKTSVTAPIFVMGMPRTGTTLTVNLLDRDPARRTLLRWETIDPVPPPAAATLRTDPRCLAQFDAQRAAIASGAVNKNIHIEWPDTPTECVLVHMHDFKAMGWEAYVAHQSYTDFMMSCDMRPTYAWHKTFLQLLQSNAPGRWVLKAPSHALFIEALLHVYPDARLVWTHRHPHAAVASLASLVANVQRRYAPEPDFDFIRAVYPDQLAAHVNRAMVARARLPQQFYDLYYDDVINDPIGEMRKLYTWLGDDFSDTIAQSMTDFLTENPQGKHGEHAYSLAQYGIAPADVDRLFADYTATFPRLKNSVS